MGRPKKYDDFIVSAPYLKEAKHAAGSKRYYVKIRCPHCETDFKEVAESIIATQKANECLEHLRVCKPAATAGVRVKQRQGGTETAVREQTHVMREQHAESIAVQNAQLDVQRSTERTISKAARKLTAICEALGISDHSSDDDERIAGRGKRKLDEVSATAELAAFKRVADAARLSPPRDGEAPVAIGKRVIKGVALTATEAEKVPVLEGDYEKLSSQVTEHNAELCAALGCEMGNEEQLDAIWRLVDTKAPKVVGLSASQLESVKVQIGKDSQLARSCKVMRNKVKLKAFCDMLDKVTPRTDFVPDKGRYNSR